MKEIKINIDLSRYNEYKKIDRTINEIKKWDKTNKIYLSEPKLHDIIWSKIDDIENLISNDEKELLNKVINRDRYYNNRDKKYVSVKKSTHSN